MKQVAAARHRPGQRGDPVQIGAVLVSGVVGSRFDADEALDIAGEGVESRRPQTRAHLPNARRVAGHGLSIPLAPDKRARFCGS
nr:hypothetical protein [uncultured Rhodococcus sp.]